MKSKEFVQNWDWQLQHIEQIKNIIKSQAMHIIKVEVSSPEEDMKHATDLDVQIVGGRVAVRIRRDIPWRDLTIRAVNGNSKTEIHKLREGYGDWYLYAWTVKDRVADWIMVDIQAMRAHNCFAESRPIIMNKDGRTGFIKFSIQELRGYNAIVASNMESNDRKSAYYEE